MEYTPTTRPDNVNSLFSNHFKFTIDALPDLTFFTQSVLLPAISIPVAKQPNPFVAIPQVGDHMVYGTLEVSYLIDAQFQTYNSLYWWMKGYGFPHSYDEIQAFRELRKRRMANPRPLTYEVEKTNAVLYLLQPDTDSVMLELRFSDVFPSQIGELRFNTTESEPTYLTTSVTFEYTEFDVFMP